jgi:hypothetical protein
MQLTGASGLAHTPGRTAPQHFVGMMATNRRR